MPSSAKLECSPQEHQCGTTWGQILRRSQAKILGVFRFYLAIPVWEYCGSFYPCLWTCPWATPPSQNDQEHEDPLPKLLSPLCHSPLGPQRSSIQAEAPTLTPRQSLRLHPGWDVYFLTFSFNILGSASNEFISFTGAYFGPWVSVLWAFQRVPGHEHVVPALMLNTTLQHSRSKILGSLLCLFRLRNPGTKLLT